MGNLAKSPCRDNIYDSEQDSSHIVHHSKLPSCFMYHLESMNNMI